MAGTPGAWRLLEPIPMPTSRIAKTTFIALLASLPIATSACSSGSDDSGTNQGGIGRADAGYDVQPSTDSGVTDYDGAAGDSGSIDEDARSMDETNDSPDAADGDADASESSVPPGDAGAGPCPESGGYVLFGSGTIRSVEVDPSVKSYCPGNPYYKVVFDFDAPASDAGAACHLDNQDLRPVGGLHLTEHCVTEAGLHVGDVIVIQLVSGHGFDYWEPGPVTYDLCYREGLACMTAGAACDGGPCDGRDASTD